MRAHARTHGRNAGSMFKLIRALSNTVPMACGGCARSLKSPLAIWRRRMMRSSASPRSQLLITLSHSRRRPTGHRWRSVTASQVAIRKKRERNVRCASARAQFYINLLSAVLSRASDKPVVLYITTTSTEKNICSCICGLVTLSRGAHGRTGHHDHSRSELRADVERY